MNKDLYQEQVEGFIGSNASLKCKNMFMDFLDNFIENGGDLARFCLFFIDVAKILLIIIYPTRTGMWGLFLKSVRDIIPYTFTYDNIHYLCYFTVMHGKMLLLETDNPEVYSEFKRGNFTVQSSD